MAVYGLWTASDGGFFEGPFYSLGEAQGRIEELIEEADSEQDQVEIAADVYPVEYCPDHDEQPRDSCEECEEEDIDAEED